MTCKTGQFDDVKPIIGYKSINLNAQHVNGITHFDLPYIVKNLQKYRKSIFGKKCHRKIIFPVL